MATDPDNTDSATRDEDEAEAKAPHVADRPPTDEEEQLADSNTPDPKAGEHFSEMAKIGAEVKGEGAVE
jgi:hypothetical protein